MAIPMRLPFCSIVIPALNEESNIDACLFSLSLQSYPRDRYEIIVIDNGSNDDTKNIARKYADKISEILSVNVGAVRNFGADLACGEFLISTDADCIVDHNWIEEGVNLLIGSPNCVFGGGLKTKANACWVEKSWLLNEGGVGIQQKSLMGSCIFCTTLDFDKVGKFNNTLTSGEDSDLSQKFENLGIKVVMDSRLSLVHAGSPTNISGFLKRQIWHSENYIDNFRKSLIDKTFWVTILYILSVLIIASAVFNPMLVLIGIALGQSLSIMLSLKRAHRSAYTFKGIMDFMKCLSLDNLYLIGRSIGLLKGMVNKITALIRD